MNCNRCGTELSDYKTLCINCGNVNQSPYQYFRVDAQNGIRYWIEQMRTQNVEEAMKFIEKYKQDYKGVPVRLKKVTEEEV
jgi:hypothetical protein